MKRKKISNEMTARFSAAVKEWARLRSVRADVLHRALKEKFGYKSYGWLWKRKPEILKYVLDQIKKEEFNMYP